MSKNMLIVEDDVVSRDLLRLVFEYDGFQCMEAENGEMGLRMLESHMFDIIILDNAMPVMTGLEFLRHVQHQEQPVDTPTIMITGFLNPTIQEKASKLGASAIVGKPYDLGDLRALVNQMCLTRSSLSQEPSLLRE